MYEGMKADVKLTALCVLLSLLLHVCILIYICVCVHGLSVVIVLGTFVSPVCTL